MAGKQSKNKRTNAKHTRKLANYSNNGSPIPSIWRATFRWPIYNELSAAAGLTASYGFRLNGMYDPDFTGIGNQPTYFDQFAALYTKYRVTSATVHLEMYNTSASPVGYSIIATTRNSAMPNLISDATAMNSTYGCLGPNGSGKSGIKFTKTYNIAKVWGVPPFVVKSEDDFASINTGNPNNVVYLWIGTRAVNGAAFSVGYTMEIKYHCDLHMPVTVGSS